MNIKLRLAILEVERQLANRLPDDHQRERIWLAVDQLLLTFSETVEETPPSTPSYWLRLVREERGA